MSAGLWLYPHGDDDEYDQHPSAAPWALQAGNRDLMVPDEGGNQPFGALETTWAYPPALSLSPESQPWYPMPPVPSLPTESTRCSESTQVSRTTQLTTPDNASPLMQGAPFYASGYQYDPTPPTANPCHASSRSSSRAYEDPTAISPTNVQAPEDWAEPTSTQHTPYFAETPIPASSQSTRRSIRTRNSVKRRRSSHTETVSLSSPNLPTYASPKLDEDEHKQGRQSRHNRASDRYRAKTEARLKDWEAAEREARMTNQSLSRRVFELKDEVVTLRNELLVHYDCENHGIERYLAERVHVISHQGARGSG